ncbi:ParB N-terminal domain-containing protein [Paenibacillus silvae]|uniref:Chromosome partitioning protein ParB n=1 Tax=Paenibacillus silvae TaxID=1325358 RepID=A0A2W6P963_9BACL|nr:ParB N-terminal domain-containing protein [Paenibacillus silvae]PZT54706.1 chromosome partitioning protein ParB [Paenibacillus silvae]
MTRFTLNAAMEYAANDDIETWIHLFLNGEGDNVGLSEGLKMKRRFWLGPIEIDISYLGRALGPELNMEYVEDEDWWNYNINQISNRIESGWDMPPLIAENREGSLSVRDGNHRLGALQKLNKEKCYVIIWDDRSVGNILKVIEKKSKK